MMIFTIYIKGNNLDFSQVHFLPSQTTSFDIHHLSPIGSAYIFTSLPIVPAALLIQPCDHTQPRHFPNVSYVFKFHVFVHANVFLSPLSPHSSSSPA